MRTDTELQRGVMEALAWEPSIDAAGIGVSAESGIVMLTGIVKSLPQKWTAVRVAQRVAGVQAVTDAIIVKLPGDSERSDADIARAAVNALDWNVSVPRNRVKVVVEHGRVALEGEVRFHYEKVAAERAVRHLIGVTGVSNLISVKPPKVSVGDVKLRIEQALERAAELDAGKISVEAADGKVTLRGTVHSWTERDEAEWAAWAAPGVSRVENDIRIPP
jgi:osmotically-inducible protein OsmY